MTFGLKKNVWAKDVIDYKTAAGYPTEGQRSAVKPADNGPGAVMILGTRSNSPLGFFAPGMSTDFMRIQCTQLKIRRLQRDRRPLPQHGRSTRSRQDRRLYGHVHVAQHGT